MKGKSGAYRQSVKVFWVLFSIGVFSFVSIFLAAGFGLLGKILPMKNFLISQTQHNQPRVKLVTRPHITILTLVETPL